MKLVSLRELALRWSVSRQTVRRVLRKRGVKPFYLSGEAKNGTLRYAWADVQRIEDEVQGKQ